MDKDNAFTFEKRFESRIPAEQLPARLRTLKIWFGDGRESYSAKTIDASASSISFNIGLPVHVIQDYNLTIATEDGGLTLHDELVYAKVLDERSSRVSVRFSQQPGLDEYARLVASSGKNATGLNR